MYFYPDAAAQAYRRNARDARHAGTRFSDTVRGRPRRLLTQDSPPAMKTFAATLSFALAPHAPYTVGDTTWRKVVTLARELDLAIHTHVAETRRRSPERAATGGTPLARSIALARPGPRSSACTRFISMRSTSIARDAALQCRSLPGLQHETRKRHRARDQARGARDQRCARHRRRRIQQSARRLFGDARGETCWREVATGDSAACRRRRCCEWRRWPRRHRARDEADLGSLVPGKLARMPSRSISETRRPPVYDPISHLINVAGRDQVTDVWVAGLRVVESGRITTLDPSALAAPREDVAGKASLIAAT